MNRTVLTLASASLIAAFPPALDAQNRWEQQVRDRLTGPARLLQDSGFQEVGDLRTGTLRRQNTENVTVALQGGVQYFIVGACDDDCSDMNMELLDTSGRIITEDMKPDALPILVHRPDAPARFTVRVAMAACTNEPCFYGVAVYGRGAGVAVGPTPGRRGGGGGDGDEVMRENGRLDKGDRTLRSGEYVDGYTFDGVPGQQVTVDLRSRQFDTYLIVQDPAGEQTENDDATPGATDHSQVQMIMTAGEYNILVTSYEEGETGDYELVVTIGGGGEGGKTETGGTRIEHGELQQGDRTLSDGEYIDTYTFEGRRGQAIVLDLRSRDFDPYLIFRGPEDQSVDNDDHEGDGERSQIAVSLEADGEYRVGVTSYRAGETGAYVLRMELGGGDAAPVAGGPLRERGTLADGDRTLRSGEYVDTYTFQGQPSQQATVDLRSNDFDTYLILIDPAGEQTENDDEGGTTRSLIRQTLTEPGEYRVLVTSYRAGETGAYELTVELGGTTQTVASASNRQRDVTTLQIGGSVQGRLEAGDGQLDNGEYRDIYVFDGQPGQTVSIDLRSDAFDTYLGLITPNGEDVQNDDFEGNTSHSRIDLTLREAGRFRVVVTSYAATETGPYQLSIAGAAAQQPPPVVAGRPARPAAAGGGDGGGQLFGVFAGISNYGGRASDLPYTAEDAVRVRNAMIQGAGMNPSNGILLTDAQATAGGIQNAMRQLAARMGPDDTFIFFYSGHGGRRARPGGDYQVTDPDGMDETLEFVDAGVTDDQFAAWMDELSVGRALILLDACFSGGFSKDVISRPGRMGMFSSEEDVTSSVAAKFRAGGYLAVFIADAIQDRLADADGDGQISAIELSQYVHERYRGDVKSADPGEFVRTGGPQLGFQHLVVDRGSIGPYDILFR